MNRKAIVFTAVGKAELLDAAPQEVDDRAVLVENEISAISAGTERAARGVSRPAGASRSSRMPIPMR
jgi:hypothetical protein